MILDNYGAPVWYRRTPSAMMDAKRLSDGRLAFTPSYGPFGIFEDQGYWLTSLAGTGTVKHRTTDPAPTELPTDHHDYVELPGGPNRRALISYPIVANVDLTGMPGGTTGDTIADGVIQEVDENDAQIWRWDMSDHFDPADSTFPLNFDQTQPPPAGVAGFPDAWDVFHINAIDRITSPIPADDGDYVVTVRHMDGVFRVDHPSGNVRVDGRDADGVDRRTSSRALTIVGDPFGGPKRPHDGSTQRQRA